MTTLTLTPLMTGLKDKAEALGLLTTVTKGPAQYQVDMLVYNGSNPKAPEVTISTWVAPSGRRRHSATQGKGLSWKNLPLSRIEAVFQDIA